MSAVGWVPPLPPPSGQLLDIYRRADRERERGRQKQRRRERKILSVVYTCRMERDASLPAILVQNRFQCVVPTVRLSNAAAALVEPSISVPVVIHGTLRLLTSVLPPDIARRIYSPIYTPFPPLTPCPPRIFTATPSRYFRAETGPSPPPLPSVVGAGILSLSL